MAYQDTASDSMTKKRLLGSVVALIVFGLAGFGLGWYAKGQSGASMAPQSLRLGGYQFINPLLVCNINNFDPHSQDKFLTKQLQDIIDTNKNNGNLSKASVYFTDFKSGAWADVYGGETFYPSSLGKIPLMIAYLQKDNTGEILNQKIYYPPGSVDLNQMQDIAPAQAIVPGQYYTVEQLIEYMIKYSDNNATALLDANIDEDTVERVYGDLNIPTEENVNVANADFITAHQISTLFSILYNGTYLSRDDSEKALQLLSQASFTQGLVAGVGSSTVVAHKLGLVGIAPNNNVTTEHELHDCGIVYAKDPYLVCVMTRGSAPLATLESIVAQLSKVAYQNVQGSQ